MYVESYTILVVVDRLSRPIVVLDTLPGLYGLKYDRATACRLPLYLCSYKLVGSTTHWVLDIGCTQHMTGDARMFNSINTNGNDDLIVLHLVIMAKAKSKGLIRLQYPMT